MTEQPKIPTGTVSRRPGGRWLAQLPPSMGRTGRVWDTESEAHDWLRREIALRALGIKKPRDAAQHTVSELIDVWLDAAEIKETTRIDYRIRVDRHVKSHAIGSIAIADVLPRHVSACLASTPRNWTRIHVAKNLGSFFEWAENNRYIVGNPYRQSDAEKMVRVCRRTTEQRESVCNAWTPEQFVTFVGHEPDPVYRDYWVFVAATGARRGESIGLNWPNVSASEGWCWLADNITAAGTEVLNTGSPKNHKRRKAYFGPMIGKMLLSRQDDQVGYRAAQRSGWTGEWVFDRRRGKGPRFFPGVHLAPATVTQRFNRHAAELKLPPLGGPHGLRRSFATLAEVEGFRPSVLTAALGHAPDVTGLYTKATEADLRSLADHLADLILPNG